MPKDRCRPPGLTVGHPSDCRPTPGHIDEERVDPDISYVERSRYAAGILNV